MKCCWFDLRYLLKLSPAFQVFHVFFCVQVETLCIHVCINQNPSLEHKIPKRTQPFETRPAVHMFFMLKLKLPNDYSHWGWMVGWLETLEKKTSRTSMKSLIMMSLNSKTTGLKKPLGNVLFLTESRGFDLPDHGTCPRSVADRVSVFVFMTLQKRTAKRDSFPPYVCTDLPFGTSVAIRNPQSFITNWLQNLFPCGFEFRVHRITGWLYSVLYRLKK